MSLVTNKAVRLKSFQLDSLPYRTATNVRICPALQDEECWCQVLQRSEEGLTVKVISDLEYTDIHGLKYGDIITIKGENVYDVQG